jgi:hypothetical protein
VSSGSIKLIERLSATGEVLRGSGAVGGSGSGVTQTSAALPPGGTAPAAAPRAAAGAECVLAPRSTAPDTALVAEAAPATEACPGSSLSAPRQALLVLAACSHLRWFPFHAEARRVRHGHRRQQQLRAPVASRALLRQRTRWVTPGARPTRSANGANVTAILAHSLQRCLLVHGPHPTMQRLS